MEAFEFEGQQFEITPLSDTGDVYSQALLVAERYQMSLESEAILSVKECSYCRRFMSNGGGEVGLIEDKVPYRFCNGRCYGLWKEDFFSGTKGK